MDASERQASGAERKENAASGAATLGQVLKNARTSLDLTVEQVATELRIEAPQLLALEQDRFERIGPPVFIKGYLRQYGQRLGLDHGDLLALYYKQADAEEVVVQPSRSIKLRDERQITIWVIAALVLAVLAVALFIWWTRSADFATRLSDVSETAPPSVGAAPAGAERQRMAPRAASARPGPAPTSTEPPLAPAEGASTGAAQPAPAEGPGTSEPPAASVAGAGTSEPSLASVAGVGTSDPPVAAASRAPIVGTALELVLEFTEECWVEIADARGERLFYGLAGAGRRAAMTGQPPISVLLGNAGGVVLTVDGEVYPIPSPRRQGNSVRFTLTAPD